MKNSLVKNSKFVKVTSVVLVWLILIYVTLVSGLQIISMLTINSGLKIEMHTILMENGCNSYKPNSKISNPFNIVEVFLNHNYWFADFRIDQRILESSECMSLINRHALKRTSVGFFKRSNVVVVLNDSADVIVKLSFFSQE